MESYKLVPAKDPRNDFHVMVAYGDMHIPYTHKRSRDILLSIMDEVKPDIILSGGDDIDAEALSFYDKHLSQEGTLQRDLDAFFDFSKHLNKRYPKAKKIYLKDNHFFERLEKHKKLVIWLQNMRHFTFESLIKADELKWDVMNEFIWKDTILFTHGHEEKGSSDNPVNNVRNNFKRRGYAMVRFHSHVTGLELHKHKGKTHIIYQMGAFEDLDQAHYIKSKDRCNWTTSSGVFYLNKRTNEYFVEPILFFNGAAMFRGKLYR